MDDPARHVQRGERSGEVPELALDPVPDHRDLARRDDRIALGALVVLALVAAVAVAAVNLSGSGPDGGEVAEGEGPDRAPTPVVEVPVAGPRDGLDSLRHPVQVSPATELVDGQVVTVTGSGFPANTALGVVMCSGAVDLGGGAAQCQLSPYTPVHSGPDGTFEVEHPVRRLVWVGGAEIDCAAPAPAGLEASCAVAVGAIADYDESGIAPVWFDDSIPAPPPPVLHVSPAAGLADGQAVTVRVEGIEAEWGWWPEICAELPEEVERYGTDHLCEPLGGYHTEHPHDPSMDRRELPVQRLLGAAHGIEPLDCAEWPGRCWVQVWSGNRPIDPVPLDFDPTSPLLDPPPVPEWGPPTTVD